MPGRLIPYLGRVFGQGFCNIFRSTLAGELVHGFRFSIEEMVELLAVICGRPSSRAAVIDQGLAPSQSLIPSQSICSHQLGETRLFCTRKLTDLYHTCNFPIMST